MTRSKRLFDLVLSAFLLIPLTPVMGVIAVIILARDGRPVFFLSERMHDTKRSFSLLKFRTMKMAPDDHGVTGGDKADRITVIGQFLRRNRLDELPQLFNILRGDISFVGPRPPLRRYVERYPELYGRVLRSRPGMTGLASLVYRRREELLLRHCDTPERTESVYTRRCIPAKARLDLIYQRNRSICLDARIICLTGLSVFGQQ